jgi:hypothetical protein
VYIGQTAVASATATPGSASFVWTVTSVPTSSAVTSASLTGPATATPSFVPDLPGAHVLHAAASAPGATGSHDVHVTVATATVFYGRYELPANGSVDAAPVATEAYFAAGADGANARAVMCPTAVSNSNDPYEIGVAFDFWEPPAGQPYKFAGFYPVVGDGGSGQVQLVVGTSSSTCASPPVALGIIDDPRRPSAPLLAGWIARRLLAADGGCGLGSESRTSRAGRP